MDHWLYKNTAMRPLHGTMRKVGRQAAQRRRKAGRLGEARPPDAGDDERLRDALGAVSACACGVRSGCLTKIVGIAEESADCTASRTAELVDRGKIWI
jgi:hypothetical protein